MTVERTLNSGTLRLGHDFGGTWPHAIVRQLFAQAALAISQFMLPDMDASRLSDRGSLLAGPWTNVSEGLRSRGYQAWFL